MQNPKPQSQNQQEPKPRLIAFEVTARCRFNCRHCRANASDSTTRQMSTAQCEKIIESIADYNKCILIFTGGEPMERRDIYHLIQYSRNLGLRPVMATCGYPVNTESIKTLKQTGLLAVSLSLDGRDSDTHDSFRGTKGAFDYAVNAANLARRSGIRFQINTTITKDNLGQIRDIYELSCELGAACFNPFILVPTGRGRQIKDILLEPEQYEKMLDDLLTIKLEGGIDVRVTCGPQFARIAHQRGQKEQLKNISGCMGGSTFGFVNADGNVQTCGFLDISAGNLIENNFNFADIWNNSPFLIKIRDRSENFIGKCKSCRYIMMCGGCRARAYHLTGDYLAADPICRYEPEGAECST